MPPPHTLHTLTLSPTAIAHATALKAAAAEVVVVVVVVEVVVVVVVAAMLVDEWQWKRRRRVTCDRNSQPSWTTSQPQWIGVTYMGMWGMWGVRCGVT